MKLFPTLFGLKWMQADLAAAAQTSPEGDNPYLDPENVSALKRNLCEKYNVDAIFGGYLENRNELWRGFYDSNFQIIHLGIDFNYIPIGTPVSVPIGVEIFDVLEDFSEKNGWGGRLIMKMDEPYLGAEYLIYGHLDRRILPMKRTRFEKDEIIGVLGGPKYNGGWSCHLHVQLATQKHINSFEDLSILDGYAIVPMNQSFDFSDIAPDPTGLIFS